MLDKHTPPSDDDEPDPVPIAGSWWPLGSLVPIVLDDFWSKAQEARARRRQTHQKIDTDRLEGGAK